MVLVNKAKVEQLKVFYAMFVTIMDDVDMGTPQTWKKLIKLREELKKVVPDDIQ